MSNSHSIASRALAHAMLGWRAMSMVLSLLLISQAAEAPELSAVVDEEAEASALVLSGVLSGAGAAVGGALFPVAFGGSGIIAMNAGRPILTTLFPPPGQAAGLAAAEGYSMCVLVPFVLGVIFPIQLTAAAVSLGLGAGLAWLGALHLGEKRANDAAARAVAGACAGCLIGSLGMCGFMTVTSSTVGTTTTCGQPPAFPLTLILMMASPAIGAATAVSAPLFTEAATTTPAMTPASSAPAPRSDPTVMRF